MVNRWGLRRTPEGGVSIGWTTIKAFRKCMRKGYWSRLHGGHGLELQPGPPDIALLYGQLWHACYRASFKHVPFKDAMLKHLEEEGLEAEAYAMLLEEVIRDIDWYWQQDRGETELEVLACEEELSVKVGPHELRGTPDLVCRAPSGSVMLPDHKTFGVIRYSKEGRISLYPNPPESTVVGYQMSRQFPFYMALWNRLHPEAKCFDAMLNMVPSHITQVLNILDTRKGEKVVPKIRRINLEPYAESYLDECLRQAVALCNQIANWWAYGSDFEAALEVFAENDHACQGYKGSRCAFFDICVGDADLRREAFQDVFSLKTE